MSTVRPSLWRAIPAILFVSFVAAVVAYGLSDYLSPGYRVHFSYLVSLKEREARSEFRFDGYYALQATDLFAATLAQWIQTPEIIVAAYEVAGIPLPTRDPRRVGSVVAARKTAPQLIEVVVKYPDAPQALRLAQGLQSVVDRQVELYHEQGIPALQFKVVATTPWLGEPAVAKQVITIATFVFTFFLGVNAVLLMASLRDK